MEEKRLSINCPQAKKYAKSAGVGLTENLYQEKNRATKNSELALEIYSQHPGATQKSTIGQSSSHSPLLPLCIGFKSRTVAGDFFRHHRKAIFNLN